MGRAWSEAHAVALATFEEADDVLGFGLTRLCWEGPQEELMLTANTQPALLTVSVAMARVLAQAGIVPSAVAGHSLGEYSAHVAAGTLSFADALRLVRRRGELMQQAVPVGVGAMAAILGLDQAAVEAVVVASRARIATGEEASREQVVVVANINAPGQTVIAGHRQAVELAIEVAAEHGAKRAKLLPVSAPFHSPLMAPARVGLTPMLEATAFADPSVAVITNIDAVPITTGAAARDALVRQVDGPVRWVASIERMRADGLARYLEVGPGKVLTGLGKRIDREAIWLPLLDPAAVTELTGA
jgi:[acyl-carrier-protein] S-malonyltransferase